MTVVGVLMIFGLFTLGALTLLWVLAMHERRERWAALIAREQVKQKALLEREQWESVKRNW